MSLVFKTAIRQTGFPGNSFDPQPYQINSYDFDTPSPNPSFPVTTSDAPPSVPSADPTDTTDNTSTTSITNTSTKSASAPSARVRYIAIGVLAFVAGIILLSILARRMCKRDRRRRLTIRLVRRRSDSSFQNQRGTASSSSFCIGEKSPEDHRYTTRNERGLSCAYSAGLAGIGTTKSTHNFRYNTQTQPSIQNTDENTNPKPNFDTPYGTSTRILRQWQGMAAPFTYVNHLPKKGLRSLEFPSLTDTLSTAGIAQYYHGSSVIPKPFPKHNEVVESEPAASCSTPKKSKIPMRDPATPQAVSSPHPPINFTSPPQSHLINFNYPVSRFNAEKNKAKKLLDSRQDKENLSRSDTISDTKRSGTAFIKFPAGPLVTVQNGAIEKVPYTGPVTMPPKVITNAEKEWMRGIAF